MRAAIAAETAGIPSVSIVCRGFEKQASATGRGLGFDGLRLAVLDGHVDAQSAEVMLERFDAVTVDQVVDGLVGQLDDASHAESKTAEPSALDIVATGTAEQINAEFLARGWTDGNPILPPTRAAVEALLTAGGHDPWAVLGIATSSGRDMTKWSVAVNAVMAGCTAEHIPVLMAAAQILADPHYGVEHSGNTTGADALMIVSGPEISGLGFNSGVGALREGTHATVSYTHLTLPTMMPVFIRAIETMSGAVAPRSAPRLGHPSSMSVSWSSANTTRVLFPKVALSCSSVVKPKTLRRYSRSHRPTAVFACVPSRSAPTPLLNPSAEISGPLTIMSASAPVVLPECSTP